MTRFVLDTNVLVSALLFRSETAQMHKAWRADRFRLAVSPDIIAEYARVLAYPRFGLEPGEPDALVANEVLPFCDLFEVGPGPAVCRDPDDDKFLHCAAAAHANAVVSGDDHLLSVTGRYRGITVLTVRAALATIQPKR